MDVPLFFYPYYCGLPNHQPLIVLVNHAKHNFHPLKPTNPAPVPTAYRLQSTVGKHPFRTIYGCYHKVTNLKLTTANRSLNQPHFIHPTNRISSPLLPHLVHHNNRISSTSPTANRPTTHIVNGTLKIPKSINQKFTTLENISPFRKY